MIYSFLEQNHIRGIILDIDDTLYLERTYVLSGFNAVGKAIGIPEFGERCWQCFLDGVRNHTFDIVRESYPGLSVSTRELVGIYRNHLPEISLCPDAWAFIQAIHEYRTGFITDGPLESQRNKCQALKLLPWIDYPLYTSELGIAKPKVSPFQLVAYGLDLPYTSCAYIADNPQKDFVAPHGLGMKTIRIRRVGSLHNEVPSGEDVDLEIATFS